MKRCIVSLVLALMSVAGYAQNVLGKWVTTDNESNVEIYQSGDKLFGKIIWLKRGEGQLDVHNPDKSLRSRKLLGVNILTGLAEVISLFMAYESSSARPEASTCCVIF